MGYILLVSDRTEIKEHLMQLFSANKFEFAVCADETYLYDSISVRKPDIIIFDFLSENINFKTLAKKIKPLCENSSVILNTDNSVIDKELFYLLFLLPHKILFFFLQMLLNKL